jgi:protein-S-isoprenylcysteine O-methyltransferase Ste14
MIKKSGDRMFRANYEPIFLVGLVILYALRNYYGLIFRSRGVKEQGYNTWLDRFLTWISELGLIVGAIYVFTDWLAFANFPIPGWWGWMGIPIYAVGLWMLWRAHQDLDRSWSPHVEIRREQKLITDGVYQRIRHPMYAGYILVGIGQMALLANWIAGPAFLVLFSLVYFQRVTREEEMMLEKFGEDYRSYMQRTGRLLPRLNLGHSSSHNSSLTPTKK